MDGPPLDLEDDWEVLNDGGFVYKRRKKKHVSSTPNPTKIVNHEDDKYIKQRRQIKISALISLKAKYAEEIKEWESLFQMLERTPTSGILSMKESALCPPSSHQTQTENSCKHVLGKLLQQVHTQAEVQEAFLHDATTLCNFAEMMYNVHKEDLKQSAFDLPVWGTPTTLLQNLCSSDSENNG